MFEIFQRSFQNLGTPCLALARPFPNEHSSPSVFVGPNSRERKSIIRVTLIPMYTQRHKIVH